MTNTAVGAGRSTTLTADVWSALAQVRDPELDEPVTDLGFVASCEVSAAGEALVRLRLPTYFCAPNFAFLIVADAYDAVSAVPAVNRTEVWLDDHFAADAINRGVAARGGFVQAFDGLAESELDQLRTDFLRKAVLAATDRACRPLLEAGHSPAEVGGLTLGDLPPSDERDRLRARRNELGLPASDDASLVIDPETGAPVEAAMLEHHLRKARVTRISAEANGAVCAGLLRQRNVEIRVRRIKHVPKVR